MVCNEMFMSGTETLPGRLGPPALRAWFPERGQGDLGTVSGAAPLR